MFPEKWLVSFVKGLEGRNISTIKRQFRIT